MSDQTLIIKRKSPGPYLAVGVAVCAVLATILLGVWQWHRYKAKSELDGIIQQAEQKDNPEEVIRVLDDYLRTHPKTDVSWIAVNRIKEAKLQLEDMAWNHVCASFRNAQIHFENNREVEATLKEFADYERTYPMGRYLTEAHSRVQELSAMHEDACYKKWTTITKDRPDDLDALERESAYYIEHFPNGKHRNEVEKLATGIPDKKDTTLIREFENKVAILIAAESFAEALELIDEMRTRIRGANAHATVNRADRELQTRLEAIDAVTCLRSFAGDPESLRDRKALCKLFLLCYPQSHHRPEIEKQLANVELQLPKEKSHSRAGCQESANLSDLLKVLRGSIESREASPEAIASMLPSKFRFLYFDEEIPMPIRWQVRIKSVAEKNQSSTDNSFSCTLDYSLQSDAVVSNELNARENEHAEKIIRDLKLVNQTLSSRMILNLKGERQDAPSLGFDTTDSTGKITISTIIPGSDADGKGLIAGDQILAVDDALLPKNATKDDFQESLTSKPDRITFKIMRSGRRFELLITRKNCHIWKCQYKRACEILPSKSFSEPANDKDWQNLEF